MFGHLNNDIEAIMSIEGQVSKNEITRLISLAQDVKMGEVIVEIGSFRGRSSIALGLGSKMGNGSRVYAVDPHLDFSGVMGGTFSPSDQTELYKNIIRFSMGEIVSVVSLPSACTAKGWIEDWPIGLLWIDGDHKYESVRLDFDSWKDHVAPNGIIAFHDSNFEGVRHFIDEAIAGNELVELGNVESLSWFSLKK